MRVNEAASVLGLGYVKMSGYSCLLRQRLRGTKVHDMELKAFGRQFVARLPRFELYRANFGEGAWVKARAIRNT